MRRVRNNKKIFKQQYRTYLFDIPNMITVVKEKPVKSTTISFLYFCNMLMRRGETRVLVKKVLFLVLFNLKQYLLNLTEFATPSTPNSEIFSNSEKDNKIFSAPYLFNKLVNSLSSPFDLVDVKFKRRLIKKLKFINIPQSQKLIVRQLALFFNNNTFEKTKRFYTLNNKANNLLNLLMAIKKDPHNLDLITTKISKWKTMRSDTYNFKRLYKKRFIQGRKRR